ncbi:MAG: metal ABC transporter permease [Bacteroidetes Order II. Incertae sedis bacterium]|jgi:manganese/zinc/iron transport system permease protein|nr:metal ABC transporter permease [Bacteroidetes Order II. bacterium]MDG1754015.1 metal ABC transporter permease [Rhodothermales bacterium]HAY37382.1 zinc ABC transporter permease [Bacteroidota bacterium]MBT4053010.1 metal ABC transporter permease [Bacteroidetes Order II. bacterium]MBT4601786.1 metal ABC transporter permease [Bacteroidetes Order II. bacterium]
MSPSLEIQVIAVVVAVACALPGTFLVLQRMSMMSDAISHAILPGIVVAFFFTGTLSSPWLILGAAMAGVLTVALVEVLRKTGLLKEDAAIGIVFPALFSVGVILIARYAGDVHLDIDAVLLGELAFAPFDRMVIGGIDIGPRSLIIMLCVLLLNLIFILVFFKELKLTTFDRALAGALGFAPALLHYILMGIVSVTAVGAFDAVGSILVVALMVAPPASAYMLTDKLKNMIWLSVIIGILSAISGYWMARVLDASIAGSMASMSGLFFVVIVFLAPGRGIWWTYRLKTLQKLRFSTEMLTIHLLNHEGLPEASTECRIDHLEDHLRWEHVFAQRAVRSAMQKEYVVLEHDVLLLTSKGRLFAQQSQLDL